MADKITPQRAYASGIRFTIFGIVSLSVDAVPVARPNVSKDSAMRRVLLVDGAAMAVEQRYVSPDGQVFDDHQLGRARETSDGTLVPLDAETVVAAKVGDLERNELVVAVHPADQVERLCLPGGGGYRLRPARKASATERGLYATIRAAIVAAPDKAFVGLLRLRDSRAFYRLEVWQDQIVLKELAQPADLADVDVIDAAPDAATLAMATQLVESSVVDFDPALYHHDVVAAFDQAVTANPAPVLTVVPAAAADPAVNVFELALAAMTPAKPKRAPRKPRARKPVAEVA